MPYVLSTQAKATGTNEEPRIAFLEDLGFPPPPLPYSPSPEEKPLYGPFLALQEPIIETPETPATPLPVVRRVTSVVKDDLATVGDGQCVSFVQAHGFSEFSGNAGTWKRYINTDNPRAGDVIVLREGPVGHVALLEVVSSQSYDLIEQNYVGVGIVSRRTIPRDYVNIVGIVMRP